MKIAAMTTAAVLLSAGTAFAGNGLFDDMDCRYTAPRRTATPVAGISRVVLHTDSGSLKVDGTAGATQIVAAGTACTSDEDFLPRMTLTMRKSGSDLHITTEIPDRTVIFGFFSARLDLGVTLPAGMPVVIEDDSGWIKTANTGALTIDDDSGAIDINTVTGNVLVEDDSGELSIKNVTGSVEIEDDSGAIMVANVTGSLRIRNDDSGSIMVQNIKRDVTIDDDGSGGIDVADVGGNFTVGHKGGGGGIDYVRVAGRVRIPEKD